MAYGEMAPRFLLLVLFSHDLVIYLRSSRSSFVNLCIAHFAHIDALLQYQCK